MTDCTVDIVVPVWNDPVETRSCIVNLAAHSPGARLILVDNGSDRETERLLEEMAEVLDDRALLVRSDTNLGFVKAANRGLARGEAPWLAAVRNTSMVSPGWLEPLLDFGRAHADAGILVPRLIAGSGGKVPSNVVSAEKDHGSFAAMLVRRSLFEAVGGLDAGLDAGIWCLRDYSRRAWQAGFRTVGVASGPVTFREEVLLGSTVRREEMLQRSISLYRERWGEVRRFCLYISKEADFASLCRQREVLLRGARQGHLFDVLLCAKLLKEAVKGGVIPGHENITWQPYPAFFAGGWLRREVARLRSLPDSPVFVRGEGEALFPEAGTSISFAELEDLLVASGRRFGQEGHDLKGEHDHE
ncbi:MAG TPA: glycosyltransferase [Geobacteraceae bacterium]